MCLPQILRVLIQVNLSLNKVILFFYLTPKIQTLQEPELPFHK